MASARLSPSSSVGRANGWLTLRHSLVLCVLQLLTPLARALPVVHRAVAVLEDDDAPKSPDDASLWVYLGTAIALVLAGGAFAGLTIALMGQDEIYLQVIADSGEGRERKNAATVLRLLKRGKHWVLVTLLLSNVITNETLPIVLDRSLGGGWPAVLSSTILIVIFGEIVPQSICVRYGLPIGAWMAPLVLGLMWIMAPVAYPTAKLLDYLLGEDHGTTYKKAGLKTLVTLHKTLGTSPDERLNEDEVTIITAVLDLKTKPVGRVMTPMKDVFTMSADTVLDEDMMDNILSAGYSRIPIYTPDNPNNFVGMLLVKMLITYDPEDAIRVRDFALATLPETRPETSCLDIINFFQEGKSHMVLVSDFPGEDKGAVGVVTLEDVIEELIGEEIIDESDVFIDVHKAIRRMAPAPRTRVPKGEVVTDESRPSERRISVDAQETDGAGRKASVPELSSSPKVGNFLVRRHSSGDRHKAVPVRADDPDIKQHLKHLGPSNAATRPKSTRINTVKIKPGIPNTIPEGSHPADAPSAPQGGVGEGVVENAGREASDGVHTVAVGYGTMTLNPDRASPKTTKLQAIKENERPSSSKSTDANENTSLLPQHRPNAVRPESNGRTKSASTIGSLHSASGDETFRPTKRHTARSGSISENIVDLNGVKKMVLQTASSSDSEDKNMSSSQTDGAQDPAHREEEATYADKVKQAMQEDSKENSEDKEGGEDKKDKKKKRKKRGKKNKKANGEAGDEAESQNLLGDGAGRS